jgi:hypothetical protein
VSLPTVKRATAKVHGVEVRGLSRGEVMAMKALDKDDVSDMEIHLLTYGTDTPLPVVKEWYADAPSSVVGDLVNKIVSLSGLEEDSGKGSRGR